MSGNEWKILRAQENIALYATKHLIPVQEITFVMHDNFDANFLNTEK